MELSVLNFNAIKDLRDLSPGDNDAFLREILTIFLNDTPVRITGLHTSLASGDIAGFARAAHTIKGSSANVGADQLRAIAERLEHKSRDQGLKELETEVVELEAAFLRVQASIRKVIAG